MRMRSPTDIRAEKREREYRASVLESRKKRAFADDLHPHEHGPTNFSHQKYRLGFCSAVFVYALGGLVGTLWETILNFARGRGFVFCNGSLLTPFNFVYGTGALVIIFLLGNKKQGWKVFLYGALGGGAVEYLLSFLEETILGTRSWDYSNQPLDINGRVTIPYMIFWGFLCLVVVFAVYRPLDKMLCSLPKKACAWVASIIFTWIIADFIVTVPALFRYAARAKNKAARTAVGAWIDRIFHDALMKTRFPAMKF